MCYKTNIDIERSLVLTDPHHDDIFFICKDGKFYKKRVSDTKWQPVKRPHITPERIRMYAKLLDDYEQIESIKE